MSRPFVDEVKISVVGGDGGDGCTSFESQPNNPRGGPDGGDGGAGGDVIVRASEELNTLSHLSQKSKLEAESGGRGGPGQKRGAGGDDLTIKAPTGTVIIDQKDRVKLGELTNPGEEVTVASGGDGGRGNRCFTSSHRQTPRFHELGENGEVRQLKLELKLIADVGLVGLPNAGKSTLLDSMTNAHPQVAEHPFTTTGPNLGVLEQEFEQLVICDIPGLVENAHSGSGLGLQFLRHVDRTNVLVQVVDISSPTPVDDYRTVRAEMKQYKPELLKKPTVIVCNKLDLVDPGEVDIFEEDISPAPGPVVGISASQKINLEELSGGIWELHETAEAEKETEEKSPEKVVKMEQRKPISVTKHEDRFLLSGHRVRKLVQRFDLTNREALSYVRERLLEIGLHKKLEEKGCRPGDIVQIGSQEFEYTG